MIVKFWYACAMFNLWAALANSQTVTNYSFLQLPPNARLQALGGNNVSDNSYDVSYTFVNPALVHDSLSGQVAAGYLLYVADISQITTAYAHRFPRAGTLLFGLRHVNYGNLEAFDDTGIPLGTFRSSDTEVLIGKTVQSGMFRFAAGVKTVFSTLAGYRSTALLADLGGVFVHPNGRFQAGMVFRNLGIILTDYTPSSSSTLPFDVQLGTTFKPAHMPARFSFTVTRLTQPGRMFDDPMWNDEPSAWRKALSHVTLGTELLLSQYVSLLVGFNALRQYELNRGFSAGISVAVRSFTFAISNTAYSRRTGAWAFTLLTNTHTLWTPKN